MDEQTIRPECLRAYGDDWVAPTGDEVREVLRRAGLSGRTAALLLGLGWCAEKPPVPYAAWAILCDAASLGRIWR